MKRILKNKRGIAMESALLFMTVVTCLCMLLTTGMALLHTSVKTDVKQYQNRLALDQIGEYFVAGSDISALIGDEYIRDNETEQNVLLLKRRESKKPVLYIKVIEENGERKAVAWKYTYEEQPTE